MSENIQDKRKPQLVMRRDFENLPNIVLPEGYTLRHFRPGDEQEWEKIICASFNKASISFNNNMKYNFAFRKERVIFVCYEDVPVATASAWYMPQWGRECGYLHMVGTHPEHLGKGLGYIVTLASLYQMTKEKRKYTILTTDDFRLPALYQYLKLGYEPYLVDENQRDRWKDVFINLNKPELIEKFRSHLEGPIYSSIPAKPDADKPEKYNKAHKWYPNREHRASSGQIDALGDESLYKASQLGTAGVSPEAVEAGTSVTLNFRYTAGPAGIPEGAKVHFSLRGQSTISWKKIMSGAVHKNNPDLIQVIGPEQCEIAAINLGFSIVKGCLKEGDTVQVIVGGQEGFVCTPLADRYEYKVIFNYGNGEPMQRLPEPVVLSILPAKLHHFEAAIPCSHKKGEDIKVHITARDHLDNRVPYEGIIKVSDGKQTKTAFMLGGKADCIMKSPVGESVSFQVEDEAGVFRAETNKSVLTEDLQLYIGDMHCHDFMSSAYGYTDAVYEWARDDRNMDFVSVSVQVHGWLDNEKWTIAKYMNERFLREGEFVTFLANEWQQTGYGDKVIHFLGGDQPYFAVDEPRYNTAGKLYEAARASDALIISHHMAYTEGSWCSSTDFDSVETDVDRLLELWSMHGSSEGFEEGDRPLEPMDQNRTAMAALRKGLRMGFVAGSDTHSARPGGCLKEPRKYKGGMAMVWAKSLTRRDVFDALRNRNTYAITGARIALKMTVNGALMGSEIAASDKADIRIDAWAPSKIKKVQILKNTQLIHELEQTGDICHIQFEDTTGGSAFYHCRIVLEDGNLAVCSPVWVG